MRKDLLQVHCPRTHPRLSGKRFGQVLRSPRCSLFARHCVRALLRSAHWRCWSAEPYWQSFSFCIMIPPDAAMNLHQGVFSLLSLMILIGDLCQDARWRLRNPADSGIILCGKGCVCKSVKAQRKESPGIDVATEPCPGRWTHHVMVGSVDEIDEELLGWIQEAADFSASKW